MWRILDNKIGKSSTTDNSPILSSGIHSAVPSLDGFGSSSPCRHSPLKRYRQIPVSPASTITVPQSHRSAVNPVSSSNSRFAAESISSPFSIWPPRPLYLFAHSRFVGAFEEQIRIPAPQKYRGAGNNCVTILCNTLIGLWHALESYMSYKFNRSNKSFKPTY